MTSVTYEQILRTTMSETSAMRRAIGARYKWFYHVSPFDNADSIRRTKLEGRSDKNPPNIVTQLFGPTAKDIICVSPLGTQMVPTPVQEPPFICLAIENRHLPIRLGLDWSFDTAVEKARDIQNDEPNATLEKVFVEAITARGSMVIYEPIKPHFIRAYVNGCSPHDPSKWPVLTATSDMELVQFGK